MFERMTERARQSVVLAQESARTLKHNYIGTEHVLLGLIREEEGLAAKVLVSLGLSEEKVQEQIIKIVGAGLDVTSGQIPFTPRAKKVLELSLREALSLGHNYIGTEHVLLGLIRENEGVAARILLDFDADSEKVRNEVIRMLSGPGPTRRLESEDGSKDVIVGYRAAVALVGQKVTVKTRNGPAYHGYLVTLNTREVVVEELGCKSTILLDRVESLTPKC